MPVSIAGNIFGEEMLIRVRLALNWIDSIQTRIDSC